MCLIIGTELGASTALCRGSRCRGDRQQVRTERVDLGDQVRLRRRGDADDCDHRTDADRDPEGRKGRAQLARAQALQRNAQKLTGRQAGAPDIRVPQA